MRKKYTRYLFVVRSDISCGSHRDSSPPPRETPTPSNAWAQSLSSSFATRHSL